jgi:glutamate racemase
VEQVEAGDLSSEATLGLIREYVEPLLDRGADTLVLGCTHYPFLREAIQAVAGAEVTVLDTGAAVARQLERVLADRRGTARTAFWSTDLRVAPVVQRLWGEPVDVARLDV